MLQRNFHVPLADNLYSALHSEAKRQKIPATQIARQAIAYWLRQQKKNAIKKTIVAYAMTYAGTRIDLDPELEAASVEYLQQEIKQRKKC